MRLSWDIFCTVIDNFGDIGVCWRLARQLACERGEPVRLWVDDLSAFAQLKPELDSAAAVQQLDGVAVHHWTSAFPTLSPQQVVIEAFACNPPASFLAAMAAAAAKPVWINLDYLSAEDWVEGCHALGSRHPRLPLTHHFFFPGFTAATGGLLRESGLLAERAAFQRDERLRRDFLLRLGLRADELKPPRLSLFCYDNAALPALLQHWSRAEPLCLLVADGKPRRVVEAWLGETFPPDGRLQRGQLTLLALPFLSQPDYDRLLWACDWNFVRGEDSFVRAQWAAKPLAWHIYPQEEDAHMAKLDAFLARYTAGLDAELAAALQTFWQHWNRGDGPACVAAWQALWPRQSQLHSHAETWCTALASQADLAEQLHRFASRKLADQAKAGH